MNDVNEAVDSSPELIHVWIVESSLDFPVQLTIEGKPPVAELFLSLGGDDLDGFVQMRPKDPSRVANASWWSLKDPVAFECRAAVRAPGAAPALLRGMELLEHVADRLTILSGYPVRVLSVGMAYDEDMLRKCIAGSSTEYDATTGGEECFSTHFPKNANFQQLLIPPPCALEAMRWFRRGMTSTRRVDQYLSYYIAIESIARRVPGVTRGPRRSGDGAEEPGLETYANGAIRYLISRHPELPPAAKKVLTTTRARIAHGNADIQTLQLASANLALVQRLAADAIALVFGIEPPLLNVLQPSPIEFMAPIMRAHYSDEHNPSKAWNGLLSDAFSNYLERAKRFHASSDPRPSE